MHDVMVRWRVDKQLSPNGQLSDAAAAAATPEPIIAGQVAPILFLLIGALLGCLIILLGEMQFKPICAHELYAYIF